MITSVLVKQWLRAGRGGWAGPHRGARGGIMRVVCAAAAGGIAVVTAGLAGAAAPAMAAAGSPSATVYNVGRTGYVAQGRWFRFVSTTLTVPPRIVPKNDLGAAVIDIHTTCGSQCQGPYAQIIVLPGGGPGSVIYQGFFTAGQFLVSPRVGDQLQLSIYYDQRGHDYFTATDLTQHTTQTVQQRAGGINPVYDHAEVYSAVIGDVQPPAADTRLGKFAGTRLTTYTGVHGSLQGPWQLAKLIKTTGGTAASTVVASPSGLSNGGQDFGVWLRALPVTYTQAFAGYVASGGPFRFIATTLTMPARQAPAAGHERVMVSLGNNGGTNIRPPEADIGMLPGGGPGSINYGGNTVAGAFTISPNVGDRLTVSIYYDQHGHYFSTAADLTQHTTQTVTTTAFYANQMPLNRARVLDFLDTVVPPPADAQLWAFTGTRVTTYGGTRGSILGPWAASQTIDTTDGTAAGAVVMSPSALSNGGQNFGVWLRRR